MQAGGEMEIPNNWGPNSGNTLPLSIEMYGRITAACSDDIVRILSRVVGVLPDHILIKTWIG